MEAIQFLRKRYFVPGNKTLEEIFGKKVSYTCNDVVRLLNDFQDTIKSLIIIEIEKKYNEEWSKIGSTGNDEWQKKIDNLGKFGDEIFHFGQFKAFEDIKDFIDKFFENK